MDVFSPEANLAAKPPVERRARVQVHLSLNKYWIHCQAFGRASRTLDECQFRVTD